MKPEQPSQAPVVLVHLPYIADAVHDAAQERYWQLISAYNIPPELHREIGRLYHEVFTFRLLDDFLSPGSKTFAFYAVADRSYRPVAARNRIDDILRSVGLTKLDADNLLAARWIRYVRLCEVVKLEHDLRNGRLPLT